MGAIRGNLGQLRQITRHLGKNRCENIGVWETWVEAGTDGGDLGIKKPSGHGVPDG